MLMSLSFLPGLSITAFKQRLGAQVRSLRNTREISTHAAAQALALKDGAYRARERGDRDFQVNELLALADLFAVSVDELVAGAITEIPQPSDIDPELVSETIRLLDAVQSIPDAGRRRAYSELVRQIARAKF